MAKKKSQAYLEVNLDSVQSGLKDALKDVKKGDLVGYEVVEVKDGVVKLNFKKL